MDQYPVEVINQFILSKQHLAPQTKIDDIVQIANDICGLHSTSQSSPYITLHARTNSFQKEDLNEEAYGKKNLGN